MTRRWMHFHSLVAAVAILLLHIVADGLAFFPTFSHSSRTTITTTRSTTTPTNAQFLTQNQTEILSGYLFNLQKSRRHVQSTQSNNKKQHLLKPAKSLAFFLSTDYQMTTHEDPIFDRAVIQAIRLASSLNDYRLILQIVHQLMDRTHETNNLSLHPRILGEAVRGLTTTSASVGKIRALWNHSQNECWKPSVGPLEVNAMIEAMCQRGKIKVAMDLYRQALRGDQTDSYSLSILFKGLASTIQNTNTGDTHANAVSSWSNTTTSTLIAPLLSVCWQWNEALVLFESQLLLCNNKQILGNPTIAALLEINQRANQVFNRDHDGAAKAILLFELLQSQRFPLDVITCTVLISQLQTEWKTALRILRMMKETSHTIVDDSILVWALPKPNARVYSAVMAVCARAGRYQETLKILEEMKSDPVRLDCELNTWMYNSVLQATAKASGLSKARQRRERLKDMFDVFSMMEMGRQEGSRIAPDTVTYNTIFSGISLCASSMNIDDWQNVAVATSALEYSDALDVVLHLLEKMETDKVPRDEKTYVHGLQAMAGSSRLRLDELKYIMKISVNDLGHNARVYNAALTATLVLGDSQFEATQNILSEMLEAGIFLDSDAIRVLIDALCAGNKTKSVLFLFGALRGDLNAQRALSEHSGLSLCNPGSPTPEVALYTHATSQCLVAGDFDTARAILDQVKSHGLSLSGESLEEVAQSYALSALSTAERKPRSRTKKSTASLASRSRAENAFSFLSTIDKPALQSIALVSKACAGSGLFEHAQKALQQVHNQFLDSYCSPTAPNLIPRRRSRSHQGDKKIVQDLHSFLMRHCARTGNISRALRLCEDIQYLAAQLTWLKSPQKSFAFPKTLTSFSNNTYLVQDTSPISRRGLGMNLPEWKWLIQAAAKSGHWKVCLSTLHMLRPYVENNHFCNYGRLKEDHQSDATHAKDYKILCSALGITVSCLCEKHQPAWVIRCIDDWISWSGQKPPHEAVIKAVRLISSKGQHNWVASLLSKSISAGVEEDRSYEIKLIVGAISTLFKDGHYMAADDIFLLAVTNGWIHFDLKRQDVDDGALVLDLHGMNLPMSHSAVRVAFQQGLLADNWSANTSVSDMVIVTGKGRHSALHMRPILRPAVQRMLVEEFYPPIGTTSVPGNMGALRISAEDIRSWLHFQRQQKGARMIEVARALKKLSSGSALRAILRSARVSDQNNS